MYHAKTCYDQQERKLNMLSKRKNLLLNLQFIFTLQAIAHGLKCSIAIIKFVQFIFRLLSLKYYKIPILLNMYITLVYEG